MVFDQVGDGQSGGVGQGEDFGFFGQVVGVFGGAGHAQEQVFSQGEDVVGLPRRQWVDPVGVQVVASGGVFGQGEDGFGWGVLHGGRSWVMGVGGRIVFFRVQDGGCPGRWGPWCARSALRGGVRVLEGVGR